MPDVVSQIRRSRVNKRFMLLSSVFAVSIYFCHNVVADYISQWLVLTLTNSFNTLIMNGPCYNIIWHFSAYNNYLNQSSYVTVKVHFSVCEKIMRMGQNGPLEKFMRFLFMRLNVARIANTWRNNI